MMIIYAGNNGILSVTTRLLLYFSTVVPITIIACLAFTSLKNKIKKQKKQRELSSLIEKR
jgi:heme/copper-type cytochrome/quinol oxidase subunit 2